MRNGLTQPALVLSASDVASDSDNDGLLAMAEILGLKLDADWVVCFRHVTQVPGKVLVPKLSQVWVGLFLCRHSGFAGEQLAR